MYQILVIIGYRDGTAMHVLRFDHLSHANTALIKLESLPDRVSDMNVVCIPLWDGS